MDIEPVLRRIIGFYLDRYDKTGREQRPAGDLCFPLSSQEGLRLKKAGKAVSTLSAITDSYYKILAFIPFLGTAVPRFHFLFSSLLPAGIRGEDAGLFRDLLADQYPLIRQIFPALYRDRKTD